MSAMTFCVITARSELRKVLFLAPSVRVFFGCVSNISGTAERICAKFTRNTCVVPRFDEFEGQGHQGQNTAFLAPLAAGLRFMFGKTSLAYSFCV